MFFSLLNNVKKLGYRVHEHRFSSYLPIFLVCCFVFEEGFAMVPKLALNSLFLPQLQEELGLQLYITSPRCSPMSQTAMWTIGNVLWNQEDWRPRLLGREDCALGALKASTSVEWLQKRKISEERFWKVIFKHLDTPRSCKLKNSKSELWELEKWFSIESSHGPGSARGPELSLQHPHQVAYKYL